MQGINLGQIHTLFTRKQKWTIVHNRDMSIMHSLHYTQSQLFAIKKWWNKTNSIKKVNSTFNKTLTRGVDKKTTQQINKQQKTKPKLSRRRRERGVPRTRRSQSNDNNYRDQPGCKVLAGHLMQCVSEGAWHFPATVLRRRVRYYRQKLFCSPSPFNAAFHLSCKGACSRRRSRLPGILLYEDWSEKESPRCLGDKRYRWTSLRMILVADKCTPDA